MSIQDLLGYHDGYESRTGRQAPGKKRSVEDARETLARFDMDTPVAEALMVLG